MTEQEILQPTTESTPGPQDESGQTETKTEVKEEPKVVPSWHDSFSDDALKADESIKKYKTLDDFGKAFKEKDSLIGRKGVILPNEKDPKDVERYLNELGRPTEAKNYANPEMEIEEDMKQFYSEDKLEGFKNIAHKHGLTQKQFEGLTKEYSENQLAEIKGILQAQNQQREAETKGLMNEWLVDYDANTKQAELALKAFSKDVPSEKVDALMRDADVKRLFFNISQVISEDKFRKGESVAGETVQTLQAYIDSTVKTPGSSFHDQNAPDHKATKQKVRETYEKLAALRKAGAA